MVSAVRPLVLSLCVLFGCLTFVLLVEIYYIFFCSRRRKFYATNLLAVAINFLNLKRRFIKRGIQRWIFRRDRLPRSNINNRVISPISINEQTEMEMVMEASLSELHSSMYSPLQGDLFGHSRLLFTITEETKEDLEAEDARFITENSKEASKISSEMLPYSSSEGSPSPSETPYATPSSSPLLSPSVSPQSKQQQLQERENIAAEVLPSEPRKSFTIIIDKSSTDALTSFGPKRGRSPLGAFLDIPSQNRIHPLEAPTFKLLASPPVRDYKPHSSNLVSKDNLSLSLKWPSSPSTPPLQSAQSSPIYTSPTLGPLTMVSPLSSSLTVNISYFHKPAALR